MNQCRWQILELCDCSGLIPGEVFIFFLFIVSIFAIFCPAFAISQTDIQVVRGGRVSKLEQNEVEREAASFLRYLDSRVPGCRFRVVALASDSAAITAANDGKVDFLYLTPSAFVQLEVQSGAVAIATANRMHGRGIALKYVGGVVFCRAERNDIQKFSDLRGKRVIGLNPMALDGWISALREFKDIGLVPQRDFAALRFGANYQAVATAVANGDVDVGVLSISELPHLYATGQFSPRQFRVLAPPRSYPELERLPIDASTRLYPGTAFIRMSHVPDELAEKVASALFEMSENSTVARSMLVAGWTLPMNYQPVHECLKELRIAPYEDIGKITLWGALGQHWEKVTITLMAILGALMVAMTAALVLNGRLRGSQGALKKELDHRKQAERTLAYQAKLLSQTSDAVIASDEEYRITFWNKAAELDWAFRLSTALSSRAAVTSGHRANWAKEPPSAYFSEKLLYPCKRTTNQH